ANTARAEFGVFARRAVVSPTVRFEVEADDGDDGGTIVGDPPTEIVLDDARVAEDTPGAVVGRLTVLDPDAGDTHVFEVDDPRFVVDGDTFRLADRVALDFELDPLVRVAVTATDPEGLSVTSFFAVVVEDRAEFTAVPCAAASGTPGADEALFCENAPGALVGLFDLPAGYELVRPLDPRFTGDTGGRLRLRTDAALDHEAEEFFELAVELLGGGTVRERRTLRVLVADRPEAPGVEADGPLAVPEGVAGAEAGRLRIADPDAGDTVVATVDDPRFDVAGDRLRLRSGETVDGPGPIALEVTVTDASGLVGRGSFEVAIVPRNGAPVLAPLETGVAVGAPVGTVMDRLRATDPDPEDTLTFAVVAQDPDGFFALDAATGELRVADAQATAEAGRTFLLRVRVTDDNASGDPAGPLSAEAEVRIRVAGDNAPPVVMDLELAPVAEHAPAGSVLATLVAEDADAPLTWSLVSGDPAGAFAVDPATGVLTVADPEALDFEVGPVRELVIAVTDAGSVPLTALQRVTVPLADRNEAPVLGTRGFAVVENAPEGTAVGRISVRDPDTVAGDEARLELVGGTGLGVFAVDPATGLLTIADRMALDFETTGAFTLLVRATDGNASGDPSGRQRAEATYTVRVLDVNEAPTELRLGGAVAAPGVAGAELGPLTVLDPDRTDTHRLLLDDPRFEVVPAGPGALDADAASAPKQVAGAAPVTAAELEYPAGILRLVDGVALAAGERVDLTVTAVDQGGLSVSRVFPIATESGGGSAATLRFLKAPAAARPSGFPASTAGTTALPVEAASCAATDSLAGPFLPGPAPVGLAGETLFLPAELALAEPEAAEGFALGEPVFLRLDDADADRDGAVRDRVALRVEVSATGDVEIVELVETAPASGRFVGVLSTDAGAEAGADCILAVRVGARLDASYVDAGDGRDRAEASSLVAPVTRVFDAATGRPVDGVRLRLVDGATGEPAPVRGDAPFPAWPETLVSGGDALDGDGERESFAPGTVRFPAVPAGRWRLEVTPPNRFRFPSAVEDAALASLPGAPWTVGDAGRGRVFELPVGPALRVDVPLDVVDLGATPS
ncbi:MAG: cadherin repeat domain-containing protein, partial [Pseudomonadales bacterium]|nr:cadherin repeat domain-containing protein [Pseudomonadales bacterium]